MSFAPSVADLGTGVSRPPRPWSPTATPSWPNPSTDPSAGRSRSPTPTATTSRCTTVPERSQLREVRDRSRASSAEPGSAE
jgi:hypothetical protein